MVRAWALRFGANPGMRTPVRMSYARMFCRGTVFVPGAAPAGRAVWKFPAT